MTEKSYRVRTPALPLFSKIRLLLKIWGGVAKLDVLSLISAIREQTGTPQNPVNWTDPDSWIEERLAGDQATLARKIWQQSDHRVNPARFYGAYYFVNLHELMSTDGAGIYRLNSKGRAFLDEDPAVLRTIDEVEGIPKLLSILSGTSPAKRADLLPEWGEYLRERSKFQTPSTIADTLRRRIRILIERGLVERDGNTYSITDKGRVYADAWNEAGPPDPKRDALRAIRSFNEAQLSQLRERMLGMHPYRFEHVIRELLEAMEYEDVTVTRQSGDKGVDVVAKYQYGITEITEVVQVKRQNGSITRPVLDQLRGALPYHGAIRGTIITLGRFAKGCTEAALHPGAAPITLIDGETLIELLLKHDIGVKRRPESLIEINEAYFEENASAGDPALADIGA